MALDVTKLEKYIIRNVAGNMGWSYGDDLQPYLDDIAKMTPVQAFERCCNWEGIIGYGETLFETVEDLQQAVT